MLDGLEEVTALEAFEHTGKEVIEPRRWVIPGWMWKRSNACS